MISPFLECETRPGLRESEAGVTVYDLAGRPQRLRTEWGLLRKEGDRYYLPIGVVGKHPEEDRVLIEFPHEADSGANRIWVRQDQLLQEVMVG